MLPAGRCSPEADPPLPQYPGCLTQEGGQQQCLQLPIALFDIALEPSAPMGDGGQQDGGGLFAVGAPVQTVQEGEAGTGSLTEPPSLFRLTLCHRERSYPASLLPSSAP